MLSRIIFYELRLRRGRRVVLEVVIAGVVVVVVKLVVGAGVGC